MNLERTVLRIRGCLFNQQNYEFICSGICLINPDSAGDRPDPQVSMYIEDSGESRASLPIRGTSGQEFMLVLEDRRKLHLICLSDRLELGKDCSFTIAHPQSQPKPTGILAQA